MAQTFFVPNGTNTTAFSTDDKGLEVSDTINGLAQKNARMWQIIALVSLSSFFIALGILIYAVNLPKTIPIVVTVNPEGAAQYIGKVDKSLYGKNTIPEIAKTYQIETLLKNMFTIVIDKDAQNDYILQANSLVQAGAITQLDTFFRQNNPFLNFGKEIQSIEIEALLKQTDKTYFVNFNVTKKTIDGYVKYNTLYSALINIDYFEPNLDNSKNKYPNILGVYITNFDIKERNK